MCKTRWKVSTSDTNPLTVTIIKINAILEVIWNSSSEYWSKACIQFSYMNFVKIYLNSRNLDQHVREVPWIFWHNLLFYLSDHFEYIVRWVCTLSILLFSLGVAKKLLLWSWQLSFLFWTGEDQGRAKSGQSGEKLL